MLTNTLRLLALLSLVALSTASSFRIEGQSNNVALEVGEKEGGANYLNLGDNEFFSTDTFLQNDGDGPCGAMPSPSAVEHQTLNGREKTLDLPGGDIWGLGYDASIECVGWVYIGGMCIPAYSPNTKSCNGGLGRCGAGKCRLISEDVTCPTSTYDIEPDNDVYATAQIALGPDGVTSSTAWLCAQCTDDTATPYNRECGAKSSFGDLDYYRIDVGGHSSFNYNVAHLGTYGTAETPGLVQARVYCFTTVYATPTSPTTTLNSTVTNTTTTNTSPTTSGVLTAEILDTAVVQSGVTSDLNTIEVSSCPGGAFAIRLRPLAYYSYASNVLQYRLTIGSDA